MRFSWNIIADIRKIAIILRCGGVVLGDSDTVLGLFAPATPQGRKKLDLLKKRALKPYIVLVSSIEEANSLILPEKKFVFSKLAQLIWPGPITLIFPAHPDFYAIAGSDRTIALRIPQFEALQILLQITGPLLSTSANITGEPIPLTPSEVNPQILQTVDAEIYTDMEREKKMPSIILSYDENQLRCVRGTISPELEKKLMNAGFI
jgi:L-threonylcarbamoyladenylate synthase